MRSRVVVLSSLLVLGACGGKAPPGGDGSEPLETVDVGEGPEAELTTEFDEYAAPRRASEMAGVLPSDFPSDVPVFSPSSVVDFGSPGTQRYVELDTSAPTDGVRAALISQLSGRGWSSSSSNDSAMVFTKAGRQVRIVLEGLSGGTRIRYEY